MTETITCPQCKFEIEVTEVLTSQLRASLREEFAQTLRVKESEYSQREAKLSEQHANLLREKAAIDDQVAAKLEKGRELLCKELMQKAKDEVALDLKSKQSE